MSQDRNSWAAEQARSSLHRQMVCNMSLGEAYNKLDNFQKAFPKLYDYWVKNLPHCTHDEIIIITKDQAEANQICKDLLEELFKSQHTLLDVAFWPERSREFANRVGKALRMGTQSASDGPAKPLLVGSTPTPCSKTIVCVKPTFPTVSAVEGERPDGIEPQFSMTYKRTTATMKDVTVKPEDMDPKDGNFGPWLRGEL